MGGYHIAELPTSHWMGMGSTRRPLGARAHFSGYKGSSYVLNYTPAPGHISCFVSKNRVLGFH